MLTESFDDTSEVMAPQVWDHVHKTYFGRRWRAFDELESLVKVSPGRDISVLLVGLGLSRPNPIPCKAELPAHLDRRMSWEALELVSKLESMKRRFKFEYHVTAVEIDPRVAEAFKAQKIVTVFPLYSQDSEKEGLRRYVLDFLPGAKRVKVDAQTYPRRMRADIEAAAIKQGISEDRTGKTKLHPLYDSVFVVDVPKKYLKKVDVIVGDIKDYPSKQSSYDVIVCFLGQRKILGKEKVAVVDKLLSSLKPGGMLLTDQRISTARKDTRELEHGYRKRILCHK
ncbi:MAG: class I SAM-dependent methyltransferase [Candidatus Altiarchaeota archaeon]